MEGEKNENSPLQSTCFIVYNGKFNPPIIYQYINETFQPIVMTQYHRGFWLFTLETNTNSNNNIELHISEPRNATKLYIFSESRLTSFKFIDITQSEELISFSEFNSFFTAAIFNHKINFSFNSSDQLEDINLFLSSFINYTSDDYHYENQRQTLSKQNTTNNISTKTQTKNEAKDDLNNKKDTNLHFSTNYNNNSYDKNNEYIIWALLFISCQPWYSLFQYNEGLSRLLMKYITPFILKNFYLCKTENNYTDFRKCQSNNDINFNTSLDFDFSINIKKISSYRKLRSALPFVDTFILFIRSQLGEGIAYIVSCIFSNREEEEKKITYSDLRFSFTSSVSSISSSISAPSSAFSADGNPHMKKRSLSFEIRQPNDQLAIEYAPSLFYSETDDHINNSDTDNILNELQNIAKNDEERNYLFLVFLTIATKDNKFKCFVPPVSDISKIAKIVCERLLYTPYNSDERQFDHFLSLIPNISEVISFLIQGKYYVPFEWLKSFKKHPLFETTLSFTSLIQNSLRNSTSKHLLLSFAKVTKSGALYHDDIDLTNRILQPGSILQTSVECRRQSMMMAGSVALSGSVLIENCYSPRNAIVLPMGGATVAIDKTATIEMPVKLKKGVTIGARTFVSKNAQIGSGAKIGEDVYLCENVRIHKGCFVSDGQVVPSNYEVPIGFVYTEEAVEAAKRLPRVIRRARESAFFYRQQAGFVDLRAVLEVEPSREFVLEFLDAFKEFPAECGRQIAENCAEKALAEVDESALYGIFKLNSLIVALSFWKAREVPEGGRGQSESESDQGNRKGENEENVHNDDKSENKNDGENKGEAQSDSKSENKSEAQSDSKSENKSEAQSESKSENKSEAQSESKSENKSEAQSENKGEAQSDNKGEVKDEGENQDKAQSDNKSENKEEAQSINKNVNDIEREVNDESESKEKVNSDVKSDEGSHPNESKGEIADDGEIESGEARLCRVILSLANATFDGLLSGGSDTQVLTIDDFLEDESVTTFAYKLARSLPEFLANGVEREKVAAVRKFIFELVDEVIVRMSIFANAEKKRTYQVLRAILEITQKKNDE